MGLPAARISDMHVCPLVTVLVPHVGGPIAVPSAFNVLIGNLPAAGVGSMCVCVGPPDVIAMGAWNVLIGGRPAARLSDMTAHGGTVVLGCFNVLIGMSGSASGGSPSANMAAGGAGAPASGVPCESCQVQGHRTRKPFLSVGAGKKWHTDPDKAGSGIAIGHEWASHEGELKKWGSDAANVKLGGYGYEVASGYSKEDGAHKLDVIRAGAHAEAASAYAGGEAFDGVLEGEASAKALAVEAEASIGGEWGPKAKEIHAKAGANAAVLEGEASGKINIPIPFTDGWSLSLGGTVEGQLLAVGAEAGAQAGWTEKDGFVIGANAKAGAAIAGLGFGFTIGLKPPP